MKQFDVNENFSVSDQLIPSDLTSLKKSGVAVIVCNRPDGESEDQPAFSGIEAEAQKLGLAVLSLPFKSGEQSDEQVTEFLSLLGNGKKIHAYCRTGNRSLCLWAAATCKGGGSSETVLAKAKLAGIDVSSAIKPYCEDK